MPEFLRRVFQVETSTQRKIGAKEPQTLKAPSPALSGLRSGGLPYLLSALKNSTAKAKLQNAREPQTSKAEVCATCQPPQVHPKQALMTGMV
jgi:hypothetical protein